MATLSREHALRAVRDHASAIGGAMNDAMEQLRCDGESAAGQEAIKASILRAFSALIRLRVAIAALPVEGKPADV